MKRADLSELLQTRFGMRLDGVQEGGAKKQEEQKELKLKDEWEAGYQRFVTGNFARGERWRARRPRRKIATMVDDLGFEIGRPRRTIATLVDDLGFEIVKEPFCAFEDTADSPIACIKDAECEETMATQGHSNQDAEFVPVDFRHQTEEWLDEGVPVVW